MRKIPESTFIAQGAVLVGPHIELGENCSVWYNAVIRADATTVKVGNDTNIQDGVIIHGEQPVVLGDRVSLGHNVVIHGATIGNNVLVGMGSVVMDGAEIGDNCLIAAGALITKGKKYPANSLIMGSPAVAKRELKPEELESVLFNADFYLALSKMHSEELWDRDVDELIEEIRAARK